jgi:hypothetical protein
VRLHPTHLFGGKKLGQKHFLIEFWYCVLTISRSDSEGDIVVFSSGLTVVVQSYHVNKNQFIFEVDRERNKNGMNHCKLEYRILQVFSKRT